MDTERIGGSVDESLDGLSETDGMFDGSYGDETVDGIDDTNGLSETDGRFDLID